MPSQGMDTTATSIVSAETQPKLREFLLYFLQLGTLGFGGPIALAGHMQKDLVEQRKWVSSQDYVEGLAFSQLSPGPLAAQLAMYLGWVRAGTLGATLTGVAFVLPSFLMVIALAALYVYYGRLLWIQGVFYGIGSAVIAIIARSAYKLIRSTLKNDWLLWLLFTALAVTTAWKEAEIVWLFLLCGIVSMLFKAPARWKLSGHAVPAFTGAGKLFTGALGPATAATVGSLFLFFLKAGAFVFGSGLAIVPFLYGGVVSKFHWLTERQFLDAVAIAMITPGPVVITAGFIGYLVAGIVGATLAALAVFVPPYLIVIAGAPYYRKFAKNLQVKAFVQGVTAASVGAIAGAAIILGRRSLIDLPTISITVVTFGLLSFKKIPEPILILAAGVAGLLLFKGQRG
jgi:chromate transporter